MKIIKAKDYDEMSRKAANLIAAQIYVKPNCVLGLATGSTPIGTYKELVAKYEMGDLDFSEVTTVNLDEYKGITKENDQSYYYFMNDNLFSHVNINKERTFLPDGTEPLIRVMVEAATDELCEKYVDDVINVIISKSHKEA